MRIMINKIKSVIKCIILITLFKIRYHGYVKFGITGSLLKIPEIMVSKGGVIDIAPHCRFEKGAFAAIDGGEIHIGELSSFGINDLIVSHEYIKIGKGCLIAPNVSIYDHDHIFDNNGVQPFYKTGKVEIGDNVWIGTGAIILRNTKIGDGCIIGAGTVVKGIIPSNTIVTGNREIQIKKIVQTGDYGKCQ